MPRLWEAVVRRLATEAAAPQPGRALPNGPTGITIQGDLGSTSTFRPDVLLSLPGHDSSDPTLLPVDAKYKRYDRHRVGAADVHQLLTYGAGYAASTDPRAVIVHPCPGGHSRRVLQVSGPWGALGRIHVLGVDTHEVPQEAAEWLGTALR